MSSEGSPLSSRDSGFDRRSRLNLLISIASLWEGIVMQMGLERTDTNGRPECTYAALVEDYGMKSYVYS